MEYVLSENDHQLLAAYAGTFSDGTPPGWDFKNPDGNWEIIFPNFARISSKELIDSNTWAVVPAKDSNTTVLWRNSLAYLPRILQISSEPEQMAIVEAIICSFLRWQESTASENIALMKSGSQDHQSALRIRSMLWILSLLLREDRKEEFDRFLALYIRLLSVENRLLNELDMYQPNNHGIMLGIAHLHTETILPGLGPGPDASTWLSRLYSTLGMIIDEDGIASENTPIYQVFYVMLLEDVVSFINWSDKFAGKSRMFELLLRAAQIGVRKQLLPTGAVPPLGDSPGGMQYRFKPMLGNLWSPKNGLAIVSRENEYLSFVAGFRSVIHKQLDDLSIAWWRDGDFIFRDAGLLSYDQNDPIAVAMRGPQGHSLPTYTQFDGWTTNKSISYGRNSSRLRGNLLAFNPNIGGANFTAELTFDGKPILRRNIILHLSNSLKIRDTFLVGQFGDPLIRFLLDPSVQVTVESQSKIRLYRENLLLEASFKSLNADAKVNLEIRESYVALEHNKFAKTKEIVIVLHGSNGINELTSHFELIKY